MAFDGRRLECFVHALDLAIRPWMIRPCQAMLDGMRGTALIQA